MKLYEVVIPLKSWQDSFETIASECDTHGIVDIVDFDGGDRSGIMCKVLYFDKGSASRFLARVGLPDVSSRLITDNDWATKWKEGYKGLNISGKLAIRPPELSDYRTGKMLKVLIRPSLAFGTGQHATTRACLENLVSEAKDDDVILDMGTGSGIIAISAMKLGISHVTGVDNDPECIREAGKNLRLNGFGRQGRRFVLSETPPDMPGRFTRIYANIQSTILINMADVLYSNLAPGGTLFMTGILLEEMHWMLGYISSLGTSIRGWSLDGEWSAVEIIKGY